MVVRTANYALSLFQNQPEKMPTRENLARSCPLPSTGESISTTANHRMSIVSLPYFVRPSADGSPLFAAVNFVGNMGERKSDTRWLFLLWMLLLAASIAGVHAGPHPADRSRPSRAHALGAFLPRVTGQAATHASGR